MNAHTPPAPHPAGILVGPHRGLDASLERSRPLWAAVAAFAEEVGETLAGLFVAEFAAAVEARDLQALNRNTRRDIGR